MIHFFPTSTFAPESYINDCFHIEPVGSMVLMSGHENNLKSQSYLGQGFFLLVDGKQL